MRGAGQALLWQLWRRHHWGLSADLAWLTVAPTIVWFLTSDRIKQPVASVFGLLGIGVLTHLVGVFSYGFETDLAKKESGYPLRAFVLPVSTRTLTTWPMISGALALIVVWLVTAVGVWQPCGFATPVFWPGFAVAAFLGLAQAIGWTPLPLHLLRVVLAVVTVTVLVAMAALVIGLFGANEILVVGVFTAAWGVCFEVAHAGVERARRGEPIVWRWVELIASRVKSSRRPAPRAFRSPLRAQLWFEMRRHGWIMPVFLLTVLLCVVPMLLIRSNPAVPAWRILAIVASLLPLMSGIVAMGFGKADAYQRGLLLPHFTATRPITCVRFVAAKMLAAAFTVLISCGILLAVVLPWLFRSDNYQSFSVLWQGVLAWKAVVVGMLIVVTWVVLSWRQLAGGMWVSLSGRPWVANVNAFTFAILFLSSIPAGFWLFYHPEHRAPVLAGVPWLVGLMIATKILTGALCARQLVLRRLMTSPLVGRLFAVWFAVVASACGILIWLLPAEISIPQLLCAVALLVPFTRLVGAPLALSFNRHR
jgi:hypothetical protein